MDRDAGAKRIDAVTSRLHHYDRSQLSFQLVEIVGELSYLRHGIEVREGAVVFDVGANVGVATLLFALHCGAGAVAEKSQEQTAENHASFTPRRAGRHGDLSRRGP